MLALSVLYPLFTCCFVAGVAFRLFDPLVPQIARDFGTSLSAAAILSTAYSLPYAIALPFIGGFGDAFGKVRMIKLCFMGITLTALLAALAWSYELLFLARVLGGVAGGSIIPLALAVVGDRYPVAERQVALSRLIAAMLTSQVFGMSAAGIIADAFGWRVTVWCLFAVSVAGMFFTFHTLVPRQNAERQPLSFQAMANSYGELFSKRAARWCFAGALCDGVVVFGFLPWVAVMLEMRGMGSIREAGFLIAGLGAGGFLYTFLVRWLLSATGGATAMMHIGGLIAGAGLISVALAGTWHLQMFGFVIVGFGFYMFHGSLQAVVSEIVPRSRGAAVAIHSTCFVGGQAFGPILYAGAIAHVGITTTLVLAAIGFAGLCMAVSAALVRENAVTSA